MIQATAEIASANPTHQPESSTHPSNIENQPDDGATADQNVPVADTNIGCMADCSPTALFTFRPPTEPANSTNAEATAPADSTPILTYQTSTPVANPAVGEVSGAADPTALFTFRLPELGVSPSFNAIGSTRAVGAPASVPASVPASPAATFASQSSAPFVPSAMGAIGSTPTVNANPAVAQNPYAPNVPVPVPGYANPIQSAPTPGYPPPLPGYLVPTPAYPAPASANSSPSLSYPPPRYPTTAYPTTAYPTTAYPTTAYPTTAYPTTAYPTTAYPTTPGYPVPGYPAPGYAAPVPVAPAPVPQPTAQRSLLTSTALTPPSIRFQGVYVLQGDESSARARVSGLYPLSPNVQFGATLDLTDGNAFSDSQTEGASVNELYLAASLRDLPNLRFVIGQLDLTSYLDRNSFAKDGASQFFNSLFQTNAALTAASIGSRPGVLLNWSITDNLEARAIAFSSARSIGNFALDGFAGEVGLRVGNGIIRGTYVSARDGGTNSGFQEIFGISRDDGRSGIQSDDREESYGVNAEFFIPQLNLGFFGRYGHYENQALGQSGDTYSGGLSFLDLFMSGDRLGVAYGRNLSNNRLRQDRGNRTPDVLEVYYDFRLLPNLRLGFTFQELNEFSESIAGFRLRTEFDLLSRRAQSE